MTTPLNNSLLKGFEVLALFSRDRPEITAGTLQSDLGMNAATAHRFLATLEAAQAVTSVRRGAYRLSQGMAELGRLAAETNPYVLHVQPVLERLRDNLSESVMACRFGRTGPVCIAVAPAQRPIRVAIEVGTTLGLTNTAQGRLNLAYMDETARKKAIDRIEPGTRLPEQADMARIKTDRLARNTGEAEPDIGAVAVPVLGRDGALLLTLSVFCPVSRLDDAFAARAREHLHAAATEIAGHLTG